MAKPFGTHFAVDTFDNIEERVRDALLKILPVGTWSTEIDKRLEEIGVRGCRWGETEIGQLAYKKLDDERTFETWRCFESTADNTLRVQYDLHFHLVESYKNKELYGHKVNNITVSVRTTRGAAASQAGDLLRGYFNMPEDAVVTENTIKNAILEMFPLATPELYVSRFIESLQIERTEHTYISRPHQSCLLKLCDPLMPGEYFHLKFAFAIDPNWVYRKLFRGISVRSEKPIMSLTAEQEAQAAEYGRKWRATALQTSTIDRQSTELAVKQFYRRWSQPPPEVVFCESPFQLILLPVLLRRFSHSQKNMEQTRDALKARFEPMFAQEQWAQMETSLWRSLEVAMDRGIHMLLRPIDFVGFPVPRDQGHTTDGDLSNKLRIQLNKLLDRFNLQMSAAMHHTTVRQLLDLSAPPLAGLNDQLTRALASQGLGNTGLGITSCRPWWGPWREQALNAVPCFQALIGTSIFSKQMNQQFEVWLNLQKSALAYRFFKDVCFVCDFPAELQIDALDDLHNATGPAIVFRDSHAAYAWHGIAAPPYVIEEPERITILDIESERNVELRRVKMTRYGEAKYLQDTNSKIIDASEFGILYRQEVLNDEPLVMVQLENSTPEPDGTRRIYFLRVPPHTMTAREAVAWSFELSGDDYSPTVES